MQGEYRRSFGPLNFTEYGEEDRMTTVAAKPPASAAEEQRHRLTVGGVAALSLDTLLSVAYGPRRLRFRLANWEPDHDG